MMYWYAILGCDCLPWLGNLNRLGPAAEFSVPPYGEDAQSNQSPFPVAPANKHSYAQNCVVWTKNAGLQVILDLVFVSKNFVGAGNVTTFTACDQGVFQSRKVMEFSKTIFLAWKVMANNIMILKSSNFYNYLHK